MTCESLRALNKTNYKKISFYNFAHLKLLKVKVIKEVNIKKLKF